MNNLPKYIEGHVFKEDDYLLKTVGQMDVQFPALGFMTKLNKNGDMPKAFDEWNGYSKDIYLLEETFRNGWRFKSYRIGKSQSWARVVHPLGFTVEIYLENMMHIVKENDLIKGEIIGEFKWRDKKLIPR